MRVTILIAVLVALLEPIAALQCMPKAVARPHMRVTSRAVMMAGPSEEEQKAAERAETLEYFKTLGGFSFGSLGLFVALTAGAGMEDVLAGNLVLVALCAYGSYLLFFDGGVTQAALENQAIQQLAEEEGDIMTGAPRADVTALDAQATASDPSPAIRTVVDDGFARVNKAISPAVASELLAHVNAELEKKREEVQEGAIAESQSFGDVLMRENRYDLKLDLEPPVRGRPPCTRARTRLQPRGSNRST